jgi:TRAP-type mannitol/chloroaromatic compound transport system substrate-binding protein
MQALKRVVPVVMSAVLLAALPALAADESKVNAATQQVETGAKQVGQGEIGKGVEQTAKGVGNTVVEGAKFTGEKFKDAGKAAEPPAKSTWDNVKDGTSSFGHTVKNFFTGLFSN